MATVFWLLPQPRPASDTTEPQPPNTLQLGKDLRGFKDSEREVSDDVVEGYIRDKLRVYTTAIAKPSSCADIDSDFWSFLHGNDYSIDKAEAKALLRRQMQYKPGFSVGAILGRRRTTVNAYVTSDGSAYTLSQQAVAVAVFAPEAQEEV